MQPQSTLLKWQYEELHRAVVVVGYMLHTASPEALHTYRDGGTGWTVTEVLCHLRDWDDMFLERFRVTVEQDNPPMPNADPAKAAIDQRYNEQDADEAMTAWSQKREAVIGYLGGLDESAWARTAQHATRGPMTLMDQLLLMTWHDMNHIEQMVKILTGQQS